MATKRKAKKKYKTKYEYKITESFSTDIDVNAQLLNLEGTNGWELVSVSQLERPWRTFYFRRAI